MAAVPPETFYFEIFSKTHAVSITFGQRYIHGQSLKEIDFSARNALDQFYPGGGGTGLMFAGYVRLDSQSPYPIIVYFLASYRPHLSHFLENVMFVIPT